MPRLPTPTDQFFNWKSSQDGPPCADDRFEVRRAEEPDFPRIYDLVNEAFGSKRTRKQFEWLYRDNPSGVARCYVMIERASGEFIRSTANFPWPIRCGDEPLLGAIGGDSVTHPSKQCQGLTRIMKPCTRLDWDRYQFTLGGPNALSRAATKAHAGKEENILGRLRMGVLPLDPERTLRQRQKRHRLTIPAEAIILRKITQLASAVTLRGAPKAHTEYVTRFDSTFDPTTLRHMQTPSYWCPHNADFLNWRYLDHPAESYIAVAVIEDEKPVAYSIVRLDENRAAIVDFAAPTSPGGAKRALLLRVIESARSAGCLWLQFEATPRFRHWNFLHRSGFLPVRSSSFVNLYADLVPPEAHHLRNWQLTSGDRDYH